MHPNITKFYPRYYNPLKRLPDFFQLNWSKGAPEKMLDISNCPLAVLDISNCPQQLSNDGNIQLPLAYY